MATEGSNLSTRMSAEAQNRHNSVKGTAGKLFKRYKVEISSAIKKPFPFLEILRDCGFITNEKYKESHENLTKRIPVQEAVYDILTELEETFDFPLLSILFSKAIIKSYPDLNCIQKIFKNGIPNIKIFLEIDAENEGQSDNQLSLEQGPGENSYPNLPWSDPYPLNPNVIAISGSGLSEQLPETEEINAMIDTTTDNIDALESQQANEQRAQQSEPAEISSEDSVEHRNREKAPEPSTSAVKRKPVTTSDNSELRGDGDEPPKAPTSAPTTEPGARQQSDMLVNFHAPILPVICERKTPKRGCSNMRGPARGWLIKRKLEQETTRKCIKCDDGEWLTPREFLVKGGYEKGSNWKRVIFCHGKTLEELMQEEYICESHPRLGNTREAEKTKSCKVCQDKRTLLLCNQCENLFHGDCHIPPEDIESNGWCCTFCKVRNLQSQQHYRESEAIERQMEPEKLKCALLLLKVYCHLENIFLKIPLENYVEEASQCLEKFKNLDIIKENLIEGKYPCVESFKQAMNEFYTAPGGEKLHLNQEEFMKNFKEVFAIQETD